jgi:hypothetical protein
MAKFQVNDTAYVPVQRVTDQNPAPYSIIKGTVMEVPENSKSIKIDLPYGLGVKTVAASAAHKDVGILILRIGDFQTERTLLDPLATSIHEYCRLLVPDDQLKSIDLRTWDEMQWVIQQHHAAYSHWILVGHGGPGTLLFANGHALPAADLRAHMEQEAVEGKFVVSLCCHTGDRHFAKILSESNSCRAIVAPIGAIHGASACQFTQSFFGYHFLEGKTLTVAFKQTRKRTPGAAVLRLWMGGKLERGQN